jgi:cytochrome c biogenesis protein CcmG/thiol:disulfide interchange protein DsbE
MTIKQRGHALAALTISALCFTLSNSVYAVEEGDEAPDFTLPSIHADQAAVSLSALRGKTVYVDFWASWCAPCLKSLPLYNEMYHKYKDQGLEIIAVSVDNPIEDGQDFLIDTPLDFLIPADPEGDVAELFQVFGMPTSYLIEPDGTVSLVHIGFRNGDIDMIEAAIQKSLATH